MRFLALNLQRIAWLVVAWQFIVISVGNAGDSARGGAGNSRQLEFFEKNIRPVLAAECYECHAGKKPKGGLALDHRDGLLKGGDSGPATVPGKPDKSLLIQSITHRHPKLAMPKDAPKLGDKVVANFISWVKMGAPDPRINPPSETVSTSASWADTLAARKQWWSFQPVLKPKVPNVKNSKWSEHPVDRFLLAKMEKQKLQPAAPAERRTLIRRVTFALTGLPPTPAEITVFLADTSPDAYSKLVERLLTSPAYGERWARHWMDLVRFAETHGSEGDPEIREAWRYRDYLIRAFNDDVSADRLIREHLAGDLLLEPRRNRAEGINESILGIAHLRLVEHGFQPVDALDDQVRVIENQIDVIGKAFQGLTIACARCHDHKFDPVSQRDYYALYGILASSRPAQVTIDSPELLAKNRSELIALKSRIKDGLADAWLADATKFGARLAKSSAASAELDALNKRITELERQIGELEAEARVKVLEARLAEPRQLREPDATPNTGTPLPTGNAAARRAALPSPFGRWRFDGNVRDSAGQLHGEVLGNATIRNGRLMLDGTEAFVRTAPLSRELREKTFEAWVALANLDQRGGGVITVETEDGNVFDSIVFAEKDPRLWVAGSDLFRRSRTVDGTVETVKPGELIHVAIAYRVDGSIALFRDGRPYGKPYTPTGDGSQLVTFPKSARLLFGRRHTGGGSAFLAGEIAEARLYDRALNDEEISASFKAGPAGISTEEIVKALTPQQRARHEELGNQLKKVHAELSARQAELAPHKEDPLTTALADAGNNIANPLHAWARLNALDGDAFMKGWQDLAKTWREQLVSTEQYNRTNSRTAWDLAEGDAAKWFQTGIGLASEPEAAGGFSIEPEGERVLSGLLPTGVYTHLLSQKHNGLFTSPQFKIETDHISVRALGGKGAMVRVIVDNYPLGVNDIFPKADLTKGEPGWIRLDTAYRKGSWAYLEFATSEDLTRKGKGADAQGRSWFGVERVVFHDKETPREESVASLPIFTLPTPKSVGELAADYEQALMNAVSAWRSGKMTAPQRSLLNFFVRFGLLPATFDALPKVAPLIAEYRRLEAEVPVPRHAPGVIETAAYDAPLMLRGDHTKPGEPVPRRYLEVIDSKPYPTKLSGRLELANEIASARNPLTARVMVNRIWQHLFGRGLVPTVDNFGRLGEKPTHPELLDYLAAHFVEEGWSFKEMIRFLVTSRAYQMSSEAAPRARETDAANEWLSHFRVERLEAEAIRDSLLVISGRLDRQMFGPGLSGNNAPRRSIYLTIRRTSLNPFLETFDAPKPFTTLGRRDATNVPGQSLALLNDPFVIDLAKRWAAVLISQNPNADVESRVHEMFAAAFGRPPKKQEMPDVRSFLAELGDRQNITSSQLAANERVWQDFAQSLFNLKEFIYIR